MKKQFISVGFTSAPWCFLYAVVPAALATYLGIGYPLQFGVRNWVGLTVGSLVCLGLVTASAPILLWKLKASVPDLIAVKAMKGPEHKYLLVAVVLFLVVNVALSIYTAVDSFKYAGGYLTLTCVLFYAIMSTYLLFTLFVIGSVLAQFSHECRDTSTETDTTLYSGAVRSLGQFRSNILLIAGIL